MLGHSANNNRREKQSSRPQICIPNGPFIQMPPAAASIKDSEFFLVLPNVCKEMPISLWRWRVRPSVVWSEWRGCGENQARRTELQSGRSLRQLRSEEHTSELQSHS